MDDVKQAYINRKIAAEWLDLDKHIAWEENMLFTGLTVKSREQDFLIVLRATRNGRHFVSFVSGSTWAETMELTGELAARGALTWQKDRYAGKYKRR